MLREINYKSQMWRQFEKFEAQGLGIGIFWMT